MCRCQRHCSFNKQTLKINTYKPLSVVCLVKRWLRLHLRTPTVVWGARRRPEGTAAPRGPPAASPPTATKATPPAPTTPGSRHRPTDPRQACLRVVHRFQSCPALQNRLGCRCRVLHHSRPAPHRKSVTRTSAPEAIYPTKSQPFSIIWEDNTDSVVDLRRLLQHARNFEQGLHKLSATSIPPTFNGARARHGGIQAAPSSSSSLSPPQAHASQAPAAVAASAGATPGAGIFDGVHSIPGDLVDLLTRNGFFAFLENLHETGRLWDLLNFRIPRLVPRVTASKDFGDSLKACRALPRAIPPPKYPPRLPNSSRPSLCLVCAAASLGT